MFLSGKYQLAWYILTTTTKWTTYVESFATLRTTTKYPTGKQTFRPVEFKALAAAKYINQ